MKRIKNCRFLHIWVQEEYGLRREKVENIFRKQYFRTVGYTDALHDASNIKLFLNWCVKMEQVAWQKEKKIAEYEAVKRLFLTLCSIWSQGQIAESFMIRSRKSLCMKEEKRFFLL